MTDQGPDSAKMFDITDERRKREAAAKPERSGRGLVHETERATRAGYYNVASKAVNELSKSPSVHQSGDYWAHVSTMSEDQLIVAISQYQNDEVGFRRTNGDAKAYAIMERARQVFAR